MPAVTRTRRLLPLILLALVGLILLVAVLLGGGGDCGGAGGSLSPEARSDIPPQMARVYLAMAKRWNIDVAFLASIGAQETDHGRNPAANKVNSSGCVGVMQVGVGGACGDFWARNKCDGNADGKTDVLNAADNVCAAARGLRKDKGAPPNGGSEEGYHHAACAYYGACADGAANYATEVMARAKRYGFRGGSATDTHQFASNVGAVGTSCAATLPIAGNGPVVIDPGTNRPGTVLAPELVGFLRRMAELLPRPLIVTTGTNHSPTTTSGNVSDHWDGHAADLARSATASPPPAAATATRSPRPRSSPPASHPARLATRPPPAGSTRSSATACASRSSTRPTRAATTSTTCTSASGPLLPQQFHLMKDSDAQ
ncbi:MAG TPA: hypothetical protein VFY45_21585 [Baekduia sp.]|nr:hypothetical protein [Baekduia sp.]